MSLFVSTRNNETSSESPFSLSHCLRRQLFGCTSIHLALSIPPRFINLSLCHLPPLVYSSSMISVYVTRLQVNDFNGLPSRLTLFSLLPLQIGFSVYETPLGLTFDDLLFRTVSFQPRRSSRTWDRNPSPSPHFPPPRYLITHPLLVQHMHTSSFFSSVVSGRYTIRGSPFSAHAQPSSTYP